MRLAVIGVLAGAFSGLFGVGGGTVIVPLLLLWFGVGERAATATSLCAIAVIATAAAAAHAAYGNVDPGDALIIGAPALLGVALGINLQRRLPERAISLIFSILLIAVAIELIVP